MVPPGPWPPGPEKMMPQEWGIRKGDEECASERKTDKPLGGGVKPPRDAGRGSGSAIGSWIGAHLGIYHVFLTSSILRLAIAMLAYRMTPELKHLSARGSQSGDPRR